MGVPVKGSDELGMIGTAENLPRASGVRGIPADRRAILLPNRGCSRIDTAIESLLSGTSCVRGIASTTMRSSYLRSTEPEELAGKEEAAAESSDALPASDMDVVLIAARTLHSGAEPQGVPGADPQVACSAPRPNTSDRKVGLDGDTKKEDPGAVALSTGPLTQGIALAIPSPGVFIGSRELHRAILL